MRVYARQAKNRELEADAFEIRERAEIRLGELIEAQKTEGSGPNRGTAGMGRPKKGARPQRAPKSDEPKLRDAGISFDLSSRAQKKAKIPRGKREQLIEKGRKNIIKGRPAKNILQAHREEERERRNEDERAAAERVDPSFVIHHAGIDDVTPEMLADASVHAVITDPPYPEKCLPLYSSLSRFAARVLKPGGWSIRAITAVREHLPHPRIGLVIVEHDVAGALVGRRQDVDPPGCACTVFRPHFAQDSRRRLGVLRCPPGAQCGPASIPATLRGHWLRAWETTASVSARAQLSGPSRVAPHALEHGCAATRTSENLLRSPRCFRRRSARTSPIG